MSPDRKDDDQPEPFPSLPSELQDHSPATNTNDIQRDDSQRRSSIPRSPSSPKRIRAASLRQSLMDSNPPLGAWQAIGQDTSKGPTIPEIRNGSFSSDGWSHEGQLERRNHDPHDIHRRRKSRASSQSRGTHGSRSTRPNTSTAHALPEENASLEEGTDAMEAGLPTPIPEVSTTDPGSTKTNQKTADSKHTVVPLSTSVTSQTTRSGPDETGTYPNGYRFPKKHTWKQAFAIFGKAFWKFFTTPSGFLITVYGLNVVAWGAMIFFLLIPGATPAMCKSYPDCENKTYSARQIWIENTSQILNALFCVTAFGLLPWRARDFYFMVRKQVFNDHLAHRKLAGYYAGWYRLPGSDNLPEDLSPPPKPVKPGKKNKNEADLEQAKQLYSEDDLAALYENPAVPLPPYMMAAAPLTGMRAPPTKFSKLSCIIWMYVWNTLFQVGLCVVMWGFNKYNRPSWATALFIVLGCGTGIVAGIVTFREGKKVKEIEGIPVKDYDVEESAEDFRERMAKKQKKTDKKSAKAAKKTGTEKA